MQTLKRTNRLVNGSFPVCSPEEQGLSSRAILKFLDGIRLGGYELHGLQIIRNGYSVLKYAPKPLTPQYIHRVYSSAKAAVIASAALFAIQEGRLSLDDRLCDIFADIAPENMGPLAKRITVYDLMNMATGHHSNDLFYKIRGTDNWVRAFLAEEPVHVPGTVFYYNNCAPHMVSNTIKRVTGQWMHEYLKPRLLDPLGIELLCEFNWIGDLEPTTSCMSLESMAKIAQFYLQKGQWDGKQLLDEELAGMMGKRHVPFPRYPNETVFAPDDILKGELAFSGGYGLFGSVTAGGVVFEGGMSNHGMFFPGENIACAMFGNDRRNMEIKQLFIRDVIQSTCEHALPDDGWHDLLERRLPGMTLAPEGSNHSEIIPLVTRKDYAFSANELGITEIRFTFSEKNVEISVKSKTGDSVALCGLNGDWEESGGYIITVPDSSCSTAMRGYEPDRQYGYGQNRFYHSGAWTGPDTFEFRSRSAALSCTIRFACFFSGRMLRITANPYFLPSPVKEDSLRRLSAWQTA